MQFLLFITLRVWVSKSFKFDELGGRPFENKSGWVSQKVWLFNQPCYTQEQFPMIIIIANNTCRVNHIYRPVVHVVDTPPHI